MRNANKFHPVFVVPARDKQLNSAHTPMGTKELSPLEDAL